jgi:hypothetical protein
VNKQDTLRPIDFVVALTLAVRKTAPQATYAQLGEMLGVSSSTTFASVGRLERSGMLRPGTREPNLRELHGFIEFGVKHVFPAAMGPEVRGVPTAYSAPVLKKRIDSTKAIVWPAAQGSVRGTALKPLYPQAPDLAIREPQIYDALTLVDALRVGRARERKAALEVLDEAIGVKGA